MCLVYIGPYRGRRREEVRRKGREGRTEGEQRNGERKGWVVGGRKERSLGFR